MPKDENEVILSLERKFQSYASAIKRSVHSLTVDKDISLVKKWLKKLEENAYDSILERKNRNLYIEILQKVVESKHLKEPFNESPPVGKLPTIPAYMSDYLNRSMHSKSTVHRDDWLRSNELESSLLSSLLLNDEDSFQKYKEVLSPRRREKFLLTTSIFEDDSESEFMKSKSSRKLNFHNDSDVTELERYLTSDLHHNGKKMTARQEYEEYYSKKSNSNSSTKSVEFIESIHQADEKQERKAGLAHVCKEKELESKVGLLERKLVEEKNKLERRMQEERLNIEQNHDEMVKKILERKNNEISELRKVSNNKVNDLQEQLKLAKANVDTLSTQLTQTHEKHIHEINTLKDISSKARSDTMTQYEQMMNEKAASFEKEIKHMKQTHQENIEDVVSQAKFNLDRTKNSYAKSKLKMENELKELQHALGETKEEMELLKQEKLDRTEENENLKNEINNLKTTVTDLKKRNGVLETKNTNLIEEYEQSVKSLKEKSEIAIENVNNSLKNAEAKSSLMKTELESKVNYYRKTLQDMDMLKEKALQEERHKLEEKEYQMKREHTENISKLEDDYKVREKEFRNKIKDYELTLQDKDTELKRLHSRIDEITKETEGEIERFKTQAKEESSKLFTDLSQQLTNLQDALKDSKAIMEKQKAEFAERFANQKKVFEEKLNAYKQANEAEKLKLHQTYKKEKEILMNNMALDKEDLKKKHVAMMNKLTKENTEKLDDKVKVVSNLEKQIEDLRNEVLQANQLRKQQLSDVSKLREEEKNTAQRVEKDLKEKFDSLEEKLRRQHLDEQEMKQRKYTEKMEKKIQELHDDYGKKMKKANKLIENLTTDLQQVKDELTRKNALYTSELLEIKHEKEELKKERDGLTKKHKFELKKLEDEMTELDMTCAEKISRCRLSCEQKLKGMLPLTVQQGLEETIATLREQINVIQQRCSFLENELEHSSKVIYGSRNNDDVITTS